jgi:putative transposase
MIKKRNMRSWTKEQKKRILEDIQRLGVIAGCRKHSITHSLYYYWLDKYNANGLDALEDTRGKSTQSQLNQLQKENRLLKEMLAEKELEARLKDELLKKKMEIWKQEKKR